MSPAPVRPCRGCGKPLPGQHLRTQLSPPRTPWQEVRTHDLSCLLDFLDEEEETRKKGRPTVLRWS